jgi:hypothetical protein
VNANNSTPTSTVSSATPSTRVVPKVDVVSTPVSVLHPIRVSVSKFIFISNLVSSSHIQVRF